MRKNELVGVTESPTRGEVVIPLTVSAAYVDKLIAGVGVNGAVAIRCIGGVNSLVFTEHPVVPWF